MHQMYLNIYYFLPRLRAPPIRCPQPLGEVLAPIGAKVLLHGIHRLPSKGLSTLEEFSLVSLKRRCKNRSASEILAPDNGPPRLQRIDHCSIDARASKLCYEMSCIAKQLDPGTRLPSENRWGTGTTGAELAGRRSPKPSVLTHRRSRQNIGPRILSVPCRVSSSRCRSPLGRTRDSATTHKSLCYRRRVAGYVIARLLPKEKQLLRPTYFTIHGCFFSASQGPQLDQADSRVMRLDGRQEQSDFGPRAIRANQKHVLLHRPIREP